MNPSDSIEVEAAKVDKYGQFHYGPTRSETREEALDRLARARATIDAVHPRGSL